MPHPGGILQLVSVPIWINPDAPDLLGTLSIGFSLDRYVAARFQIAHQQRNRIRRGRQDLLVDVAAGWVADARGAARQDGLSLKVQLKDTEYIAMTMELSSDVTSGR